MKKYIKDNVIKTRQEIVIVKNGMKTINPTEEMILSDGWVEYVPQVNEGLSDEEVAKISLVKARHRLRNAVLAHDSSEEVNAFTIGGVKMWLDKATRAGLMLRFQAEQQIGKAETTLWYSGTMYSLPIENAFGMLFALEVYASACYDNTQRHLANIQKLETAEEVEAYDYTEGYPAKLKF